MIKRPEPIDEEVIFDGRSLITETDLKGIITFVNRKFVEMTGYSKQEAIGESHNILRQHNTGLAALPLWEVFNKLHDVDCFFHGLALSEWAVGSLSS